MCASAATRSSSWTARSSWTPDRTGRGSASPPPRARRCECPEPPTSQERGKAHGSPRSPDEASPDHGGAGGSCPGTPAPPRHPDSWRQLRPGPRGLRHGRPGPIPDQPAVEARGIEPLTPACKAGVFPLAPRPRCATKGSAATPAPDASCPRRRGKGGVAAVPGLRSYGPPVREGLDSLCPEPFEAPTLQCKGSAAVREPSLREFP